MAGILTLHQDAEADLEDIARTDPRAAAMLTVALQEIEGDPRLAERLLDHGFGVDARGRPHGNYSVKKWVRFWNGNRDIWRLRCIQLESQNINYRIVYAYLTSQRAFQILAIAPKDRIDYDNPDDPLALRIRAAYDDLS